MCFFVTSPLIEFSGQSQHFYFHFQSFLAHNIIHYITLVSSSIVYNISKERKKRILLLFSKFQALLGFASLLLQKYPKLCMATNQQNTVIMPNIFLSIIGYYRLTTTT